MDFARNVKENIENDSVQRIYLAGGCFWGMQKFMQSIPGVVRTTSGYANGTDSEAPTYATVCTGKTGHRETVRVEYNPNRISLDAILFAFFSVIDPTVKNAQGHDLGTQYQTGIYYEDEESEQIVLRISSIEKERAKKFEVEIKPIACFYDAEEYHQQYLDKNPSGYCHIPLEEMKVVRNIIFDPADYKRPAKEMIAEKLTKLQYNVTQEAATEQPFKNEHWNRFEKGVYVDIVTGEPLFSSKDKYKSSCGWPSFSRGIDKSSLVNREDSSHFIKRTEVRSRAGNSHLGHVFEGDSESPNGIRYCINSAALRFINYDNMEQEGYGYLKKYIE